MTFTKEQQKLFLGIAVAVIVLVNGYRILTAEGPRTAPLMYERGAVASTPVRPAAQARGGAADPLSVILERSAEPYPGVVRNIFRMENPAARPKLKPAPVVVTAPSPTSPAKTAEEIAADLARADLEKFRYLGYLSEKETTLFLSKGGELFIVKIGDKIGTTYTIKEANKDFIVILDTATRVEGRVSLSGDGTQQPQLPQQPRQQPPLQPQQPQYAPQPQRPQRPSYAPQTFPPPVSQP